MAAPDQGLANTFPIRTIEQLLEELQASFPSLGIREDDFRRPKKERWEQIFIQIVSTVHQINPDNLRYSNLRSKVALAKEENNRLANMIVPSPNRIKAEMDHRKKQLQDLINSKNEKIIRLEEVDSRRQLNKETQEECESALKIINNFKQNVELERLSQQEIADIQQKAAVTRDQLWEVEQELQQMARMKLTRAEKMDKMKLQMGERLADKKMEIEQSSREIEHLQLSLSDDHAKRSATREGMKRLEAEERKNVELYTQQMQLLQSKYKELQQALDSYHVRLSAGCRDMLDKIQ
uniref:Uncharacterized protein n=1 Tax=Capitella teleta TaxID=283909 RepID=X2ARP4_CAPTE